MAQIPISKATYEKLDNGSLPKEELEPQQSVNNKRTKKHKKKDPITRAETRYKNALQKIKTSQPLTRKEFRELVKHGYMLRTPGIIKRNEKFKKEKQITTIKTTSRASTFFYSPKKTKTNAISKSNSNKSTSCTTSFDFDPNNPVSEFEARNVEFGHGRTKSKEWNDEIAKSFQKELKERRKNPDWTDRFALK